MNILGCNGSPRKGGNTFTVMEQLLKGAAMEGADVEQINLADYDIHGCVGCERCRIDTTCTRFHDDMHLLYPKIEKAEILVLGSPTYNYCMTPWMKCFIDRLYPYFNFTKNRPGPYTSSLAGLGKKALIFGICEQHSSHEMHYNIGAMRDAIKVVGYEILDTLSFTGHFTVDSIKKDTNETDRAYERGRTLARGF